MAAPILILASASPRRAAILTALGIPFRVVVPSADETLLLSAQDGVASLRFYQWSPATLSLGYFQPASSRLSDPRLAPLAYVRRR